MNHAGANTQGGQHGQAIPGQDSRVRNDTLRTPQDNGRREEDETQAQNVQSQIPVAPYARNAYAGTLPEGTCRDMNWHEFALSSLGDAYTNDTTNSSRGRHMTNPTRGFDDDNAVFLAPPYAHDLSVYELQPSPMSDDQEFLDMAYAEIQATSNDLRSYDALLDPDFPKPSSSRANGPSPRQDSDTAPTRSKRMKMSDDGEYVCNVGDCAQKGKPFGGQQEYWRHLRTVKDPAHGNLRRAAFRRLAESDGV